MGTDLNFSNFYLAAMKFEIGKYRFPSSLATEIAGTETVPFEK